MSFRARVLVALLALALPLAAFAQAVIGLTSTNQLIRFDAGTGANATVPITGLIGGDTLIGIDVRPANGQLYAVSNTGRIYTLDVVSGVATFAVTMSVVPSGTRFGIDFNPVVDRLRVVSDTGQNLRVNPNDGVTLTDGAINPGSPQIAAVAYINSFAGTGATQLYYLDAASNSLLTTTLPNAGTVTTVGATGVDFDTTAAFDILFSGGTNIAYASLTVGGVTNLYQINLATGAATQVTSLGATGLLGIAVGPGGSAVLVPANDPLFLLFALLAIGGLALYALRRRAH